MKTYHLRYHSGGWELRQTGSTETLIWAKLKSEAITKSKVAIKSLVKEFGKPVSFRVCDKKGKIQNEWTYPRSADPRKSKG